MTGSKSHCFSESEDEETKLNEREARRARRVAIFGDGVEHSDSEDDGEFGAEYYVQNFMFFPPKEPEIYMTLYRLRSLCLKIVTANQHRNIGKRT